MLLKWIILFSLTSTVWGYRFTTDFQNGFYWAQVPINITVIDNDSTRQAKIEALALAAIDDWQTSSGLQLWDYTGAGTKNIIRWSNNFAKETNMDPSTVLAVAIRYTEGPYFAKTEIVINGGHTYNSNDALLRTTLTHELGHTMGLDHSEVGEAVMAPTLQPFYTGLHSDDLTGVHAAFQEMEKRQEEKFVSPLASQSETKATQPLSCGTVGPASAAAGPSGNGALSLVAGLLISFIRKVLRWVKSRL